MSTGHDTDYTRAVNTIPDVTIEVRELRDDLLYTADAICAIFQGLNKGTFPHLVEFFGLVGLGMSDKGRLYEGSEVRAAMRRHGRGEIVERQDRRLTRAELRQLSKDRQRGTQKISES